MTAKQQAKLDKSRKNLEKAYREWQADTSGRESDRNKILYNKWLEAVRKQEALMEKFF